MTDEFVGVPVTPQDVGQKPVDCRKVVRLEGDRYIQRVELVDRNGNPITDSVEGSLVVSDIDHYLIHAGRTWVLSDTVSVLAGANLDFLIVNGALGEMHVKDFSFSSTLASANIIFYRDPVTTANGTLQTVQNKNWGAQTNTPHAAIYITPTVTSVGTQLEHFQISAGKQTGGSVQGGGDEWVVPINRVGLLRYTNNSAQTDTVSFVIKLLDIN